MPQTVPSQHPAVVLRSHYRHVRALLAIAMIAVVGLTVAVVSLATDDGATSARSVSPASAPAAAADGPRYIHSPGQRYDRGTADGPRGPQSYSESSLRSYQPAPADSVKERVDGPRMMLIPQGPGAR